MKIVTDRNGKFAIKKGFWFFSEYLDLVHKRYWWHKDSQFFYNCWADLGEVQKIYNRLKPVNYKENQKMNEEIEINGEIYVKKGCKCDDMPYVIVRTYSAGVFAGYLESREGKEVVMRNARRLWSWSGAASLSQLAMEGVSRPHECKFPCEVDRVVLTEAVEILDVTNKAQKIIKAVPVWSA